MKPAEIKQQDSTVPAKGHDDKPETHAAGEIKKALKDLIDVGLDVEVKDETFTLKYGAKEDSGTTKQPVDAIVTAARNLMGAETIKRLHGEQVDVAE